MYKFINLICLSRMHVNKYIFAIYKYWIYFLNWFFFKAWLSRISVLTPFEYFFLLDKSSPSHEVSDHAFKV